MKRRAFEAVVMAFAIGVVSTASPAVEPGGSRPESAAAPRVRLNLQPAQQETLKMTMREHLSALQAIVSALAQGDYDKASTVAHTELGFPKHHEAMQREQGFGLPAHYQELAVAHHQAAEVLAKTIAAKKMAPILLQLEKTIQVCNACHDAYRM